jgi:hypothetical protein
MERMGFPINNADAASAREWSQRLCQEARSWAKVFMVTAQRHEEPLREAIMREVLAFELYLLGHRLHEMSPKTIDEFLAQVRTETWRLFREQTAFAPASNALPWGGQSGEETEFARQCLAYSESKSTAHRLSEQSIRDFCEATGLGSNVLVGQGSNLATILFYMAVHGHFHSAGIVKREDINLVLRAARECRPRFEARLDQWLNAEPGICQNLISDDPGEQSSMKHESGTRSLTEGNR